MRDELFVKVKIKSNEWFQIATTVWCLSHAINACLVSVSTFTLVNNYLNALLFVLESIDFSFCKKGVDCLVLIKIFQALIL